MSLNDIRYVVVARADDKMVLTTFYHGLNEFNYLDCRESSQKVLLTIQVLERPKLSVINKHAGTIHYESDEKCIYMVTTSFDYPQRAAFLFLDELKQLIGPNYYSKIATCAENELDRLARRHILPDLCSKYCDLKQIDKIYAVKATVENTKTIMNKNITALIVNQDRLDELGDKSDALREDAMRFRQGSRKLHSVMWWKNAKVWIIVASILVFIIIVLTLIVYSATKSPKY